MSDLCNRDIVTWWSEQQAAPSCSSWPGSRGGFVGKDLGDGCYAISGRLLIITGFCDDTCAGADSRRRGL